MQIKMTAVSMALAGAVLLASGCVPSEKIGSVAALEPAEEAAPRGFYFKSGVLEFGDFDPYSLGDSLFSTLR